MTKLALSALVAGNFMLIVDVFIVNVALREIQLDLNTSVPQLQAVVVVYSLMFGTFLLIGARLGDRFGRRKVYLYGVLIFMIASASGGLAQTPAHLIWSRAIQGLGASLMMPQVYSSLRVLYEDQERDKAFSIMGAAQGLAGIVSQMLGGVLILISDDLGWRMVFLVNIPIAICILIIGRLAIPETKATEESYLDILGAFLAAASVGLFLGALMYGRENNWASPVILTFVVSGFLLLLFFVHQKGMKSRGRTPIFDTDLFFNPTFSMGVIGIFFLYSAIGSFAFSLTMWLQGGLGMSPLSAGILFTPSAVFFFVGSISLPHLQKKFGRGLLPLGASIFAFGLLIAVATTALFGFVLVAMLLALVLIGLGQGIAIPLALSTVVSSIQGGKSGMASGMVSTLQMVGSAFGVALVGIIFFASLGTNSATNAEIQSSFSTAFAVASTYNLIAALISSAAFFWIISVRIRNDMTRSQE